MNTRLQKATDFMKAAHRSIGQTRKDGKRPYEVHPLNVHDRLFAVNVFDEDILIAALFHDILEDVTPKKPIILWDMAKAFGLDHTAIWYYDEFSIEALFGMRVAGIVIELTDIYTKEDWPKLNRRARKQLERERYAKFSTEAKLIKLADIASNLEDDGEVLENGKPEVGFNVMFIKEKELCLPYLRPTPETPDELRGFHSILWAQAFSILEKQKKKFDVR